MTDDRIYYAIGDVHGEYERLLALHGEIRRDHGDLYPGRGFVIVHLGDYVDRGPDSAGVVEMLMALDASDEIICLKGNHEEMMIDALRHGNRLDWWLDHGGTETLTSYRSRGEPRPPESHLNWIDSRPLRWDVPDRRLTFVHAAINERTFPDVDERRQLWGRSREFFESEHWDNLALEGYRIVHGHTPTDDHAPEISADGRRINVDTGAVYGGALTAVVLASEMPPRFLSV